MLQRGTRALDGMAKDTLNYEEVEITEGFLEEEAFSFNSGFIKDCFA